MSRPQRNQHVRQALLHAGTELLSEQGYHGTGLKEILTRVNVPKGSFYHYFSSKEAFTADIITNYADWLMGLMDAAVAASKESPRELIRTLYGHMIVEFERQDCVQGCLLGNLAAEIGAASKPCQAALQDAYGRWKQRFSVLVADGQQAGQFRQDLDADTLSDLFWDTWEGSILRMKLNGSAAPLRRTLNQLLDNLLAAPATQAS